MAATATITKALPKTVQSEHEKPTRSAGRRLTLAGLVAAAAFAPAAAARGSVDPLEDLWREFEEAQAAFLSAYQAEDASLEAAGEVLAHLSSTPSVLKASRLTAKTMRARDAVMQRVVAIPPLTFPIVLIQFKAADAVEKFSHSGPSDSEITLVERLAINLVRQFVDAS